MTGVQTCALPISVRELRKTMYQYFDMTTGDYSNLVDNFKKLHHLIITDYGYDEYYLLKSDKKTDEEDDVFETNASTAKSITNAFVKFANNKTNSKTVLNRFIGLIS